MNGAAGGGAGEAEYLFHEELETSALLLDEHAIALYLRRVGGEFAAQIVGGGVDHGERGAELVGDAGDEIHLEVGQLLGAAGVGDEGGDARHHQQEYAGR